MLKFFDNFLQDIVIYGTLSISVQTDNVRTYTGRLEGPSVGLHFRTRKAFWHFLLNPELALGEGYMDGDIEITEGELKTLFEFSWKNFENIQKRNIYKYMIQPFIRVQHIWKNYNFVKKSKRDVAHHYDLSDEFFSLFLDSDRQYSCAYFESPQDSLEEAQANKKMRLAKKLHLSPEQKVLDIGSGWGGLSRFLANQFDVHVDGITLSENQYAYAVQKAKEAGDDNRVKFALMDYRAVQGPYDRIVSVGMLEHVGEHFLPIFFKKISNLLNESGVALIHTIGVPTSKNRNLLNNYNNPWIEKYIFPGGYLPSLPQLVQAVAKSGLMATDIEILRLHYAETLNAWRQNFYAKLPEIRKMYDERFIRMWDFYLTGSEMLFRTGRAVVYQIQLIKQLNTLPITRHYMSS